MAYNYFLGNRKVIRAMLNSAKAKVLLNKTEKKILERFGHIILCIFGYPLSTPKRLVRRIVLDLLKSERIKNGKLLDVGCSMGHDSFELAKRHGYHVVGIDINEISIETANEIKNILNIKNLTFLNMDFLHNNFQDEEFDIIIMLETLEHVENDFQTIKEINRILKRGGIFILSTPYTSKVQEYSHPKVAFRLEEDLDKSEIEELFKGGFHWRNGYDENSIKSLLEKNDLEIINVRYVCVSRALLMHERMYFPLTYPLSLLTKKFFSNNRLKIVVKAKK